MRWTETFYTTTISYCSNSLSFSFSPHSGQAKVKESLSYTAYKNMLKNILRYKEAVEPADLQQFVILKDSLNLGNLTLHSAHAIRPSSFSHLRAPSFAISPRLSHSFSNPSHRLHRPRDRRQGARRGVTGGGSRARRLLPAAQGWNDHG